ncbi:MAG: DUF4129 domain-containing protein [Phaeodactylibacter sp.]|uniref:DUF4129 domain-containing protein n=1 Tax=Phaeodactylibacter sp. TaxID=1940289 RepID=UPI0032EBABFA
MMHKGQRIIRWLLPALLAFGAGLAPLPAQSYLEQEVRPAEVDRERWAAAKEGIDYGVPEPRQERERSGQSENQRGGGEREGPQAEAPPSPEPWVGGETAALLLRLFFWILIAVFIAVIIRYLLGLKRPPGNPSIEKGFSSGIDLEAIEEDLPEVKLEDFLQQAINNKEYTLAVRLYYLVLLQGLAHKKQVAWQKDKTNNQYVQELSGTPLQADFRRVTLLFERVWYGDQQIDEAAFESIAPRFQDFAQRIQDLKPDYAQ